MVSTIEEQVEAFASGTAAEYTFPAELSAEERKLVKIAAEKSGLSSQSLGISGERRIHIFKPAASTTQETVHVNGSLKTAEEKNTLVDSAHQSIPAGGLPDNEPGSSADSGSQPKDPTIIIKNTFLHVDSDSKENGDPRITQSMPNGKFVQTIEDEMLAAATATAAAKLAKQDRKPLPLSEEPRQETALFPSTPNGETLPAILQDLRCEAVSVVPPPAHDPSITILPPAAIHQDLRGEAVSVVPPPAQDPSITILPPASWMPSITAPTPNYNVPSPAPVYDYPGAVSVPQTPPQAPPQAPAIPGFVPGTPVMLTGLANQPDFNGLRGTVSSFDADSSRYNILLDVGPNTTRRMVKVKFQNLRLSQSCVLPPQLPCFQQAPLSMNTNRPAKQQLTLHQML